jgi:hypothetical protein
MSELIEMTVKGQRIKMKRMNQLTLSDLKQIENITENGYLGEAAKVMKVVELCIINDSKEVSELFGSMTVHEFGEFVTEWSELNELDGTFD